MSEVNEINLDFNPFKIPNRKWIVGQYRAISPMTYAVVDAIDPDGNVTEYHVVKVSDNGRNKNGINSNVKKKVNHG